jgi:hypothetical protein
MILIGPLLLYPLSFGPACWLADRDAVSLRSVASWYLPLLRTARNVPEARRVLLGYGCVGCSKGRWSSTMVYLYMQSM